MKKGLLALLLALLALTTLPAVAYELEGEGAVVTDKVVGLPVTLDISSGSGTAETYIDIGFSQETSLTSKMTPSYNPATASEVTLIGSAGTGMLNPNEELYVYWVVRGADKFKASLYVEDVLFRDGGTDGTETDELDWTITWTDPTTKTQKSIGDGTYNTTGEVFLDRTGDSLAGACDAIPLSINTAEYTGKTAGVYSGELTLHVEPVEG